MSEPSEAARRKAASVAHEWVTLHYYNTGGTAHNLSRELPQAIALALDAFAAERVAEAVRRENEACEAVAYDRYATAVARSIAARRQAAR